MREDEIRQYALLRARECIEDWAHEDVHENNYAWGTDFTDEEMAEIVRLAQSVKLSLP